MGTCKCSDGDCIKDKYLITYGFHPNEEFSEAVGKRLEKNPPKNSDVIYYRPSSITSDHRLLSYKEMIKESYKGAKELRQYANEKYNESPFIIELHDTPYYQSFSDDISLKYGLMYPRLNTKLRNTFEEFERQKNYEKIITVSGEMQRLSGYYSTIIEFWPNHFNTKTDKFHNMNVEEAELFTRDVIEYIQKKN